MLKTTSGRLQLLGVIALGLSFSCSSGNLANTPCSTALDCPAGQACSPSGYCEALLGDSSSSSSSSGSSSGSAISSNNGSSGGYHGGSSSSSSGAVNGSSSSSNSGGSFTLGGSSSSGSSSTSTAPTCGCSTSCCSEQASSSSTKSAGGLTCPNGSYCYGSYYCSLAAGGSCSSSDPCSGNSGVYTSCSSSSGSSSGTVSGSSSSSSSSSSGSSSGTPTGTVGPQGGSVSSLVFAIAGDTRPQNEGDTAGYPTAIITGIYADIAATVPAPQFAIGTGDYAYCSGSDCAAQTANYITAAAQYSGQKFLTMGNHECNGFTSSNCSPSAPADGATSAEPNFVNFFNVLNTFGINSTTQPTLASGDPYYEVDINSSDSSNPWTSKFVFIAANAWDSGQSTWLTSVMQKTTTYTFVMRHESYEDDGAASSDLPGDQGASDAIIQKYPYTLLIVGHTHVYQQSTSGSGQVELVIGNGGAESSGNAGYEVCTQLSGGNISCQNYNEGGSLGTANGSPVVVNAAGALQ